MRDAWLGNHGSPCLNPTGWDSRDLVFAEVPKVPAECVVEGFAQEFLGHFPAVSKQRGGRHGERCDWDRRDPPGDGNRPNNKKIG